jgi:hypothetical protein
MLYRAKFTVCSEIHTKHINALCRQNMELLTVKPDGSYSNLGFKSLKILTSVLLIDKLRYF